MKKVLTLLLAGGEGARLFPLTRDRAKPAVSFGGIYRLIDFTLSNCVNSGLRQIGVLMQTKSTSLNRHLQLAWNEHRPELEESIFGIHPDLGAADHGFKGTADAVFQNLRRIGRDISEILIVAGDHIYKMDYARMIEFHRDHRADATVAVIATPRVSASRFGIIEEDAQGRIVGFEEKPANPKPSPHDPSQSVASMGVYVFSRELLLEALTPAAIGRGEVDFGRDILPKLIHGHRIMAYPFTAENRSLPVYWRDVGTIDALWAAHMDLLGADPAFTLHDSHWPLRTYQPSSPPARFIHADTHPAGRRGQALDAIVSPGVILDGGTVRRSVLSPNVRIDNWAEVTDSVLMAGVTVGEHCRIQHAIIDKGVVIPPHTVIGDDPVEDGRRFHVSPGGVVVIPKYAFVPGPDGHSQEPAQEKTLFAAVRSS